MVKTIRGRIGLDRLKELLTEHARKLPSYRRVETDAFEVCFYDGSIRIELREPYEAECWYCDGKGKEWHYGEDGKEYDENKICPYCKGRGRRTEHRTTSARIREYQKYPRTGQLKVEVNANGHDIESWRPEVDKIKAFIEGLVGEPCIAVPMTRKERLESQPPLEDQLQKTLDTLGG